ncbi:hypothetical protein [Desulfosporosinus sp. BG]|uniref:hypothetical protein n=1 Tax=Desulfosporosinus sp. BG TaxID=1633135 RepID=UPI00083A80E6|nr:hypothetical protein [Desulfosporosinus sp. BG]ODA41964.1 hypothetical protein DSBG_1234 [Desulfosporosinus sp. BG]
MPKRTNYQNMKFNPLYIVVGALLLIAIFRTHGDSAATTAPITTNWNLQDLDITKNGNALRALLFLETNKTPTSTSPSPSMVLNKPTDFYGQCLQFTGTIKSVRSYSPQSSLATIIIGNSTEMIMLTNDASTMLDCFLIGSNLTLTPGSAVTVYGYSPGIRYAQDAQGRVTPQLALIGHFRTVSSSTPDVSPNTTFPVSPSLISPISPTPS